MFWLAVTAAAIAAPPAQERQPQRQATATVRIVRAEPLHFDEMERREPKVLRTSQIRTRDGRREPARLFEYQ